MVSNGIPLALFCKGMDGAGTSYRTSLGAEYVCFCNWGFSVYFLCPSEDRVSISSMPVWHMRLSAELLLESVAGRDPVFVLMLVSSWDFPTINDTCHLCS